MPLELRDADLPADFPALIRVMFESYEEPWQPSFHVYSPILGTGAEAREAAIREAATRLEGWYNYDPTMHWQKVVDTETGDIAAGALWKIHPENPFAQEIVIPATWFPDDGSRRYAEQWMGLHDAPRERLGKRPQVYLLLLFTLPRYRKKGAAQQIMEWGAKKADEMGVESFLESTPMGRSLYERNGYTLAEEIHPDPKTDNPDDAWREIEAIVGSTTHYLMWRPAGGYKEGETVKPWEEK